MENRHKTYQNEFGRVNPHRRKRIKARHYRFVLTRPMRTLILNSITLMFNIYVLYWVL